MRNQQIDVWEKRWHALNRILQNNQTGGDENLAPRQETLKSLRKCLQVFGGSHYDFFKSGFEGDEGIYLEPSPRYPQEYVLSIILDQISFDLDVMARAEHFRMPTALPEMRTTLNKADILAYAALEPAIKANLLPDMTVVTYFQKSVTVRILPYAPVALIGIPFSTIDSPRDLLAIPHEVGHYVYRHGIFQQCQHTGSRFEAVLSNELAGRPQWLLNWLEEIFADVYGCLVAGPLIALSFQDLQAALPLSEFIGEDGEHPTPALRPNIYHRVLEHSGLCPAMTQALETRWAKYLATRPGLTGLQFAGAGVAGQALNVDLVNTEITSVINKLMDQHLKLLLDAARTNYKNQDALWAWHDVPNGEAVDGLYARFAQQVEHMPSKLVKYVPELILSNEKEMYLTALKADKESKPVVRKVGETGLWIDALKAKKGSGQPLTMPAEIWTALLNSNGWATEGPGGGNAHGG
ncbi:MAG: hypothetical protein NT075_36010 [Chloroflexi bacterium]|nr:hypothetical protein [Chloroflexota bacterium]